MNKYDWHQEICAVYKSTHIIVLYSNIFDNYRYPDGNRVLNMSDYLTALFKDLGYNIVVKYDGVQGFSGNVTSLKEYAAINNTTIDNLKNMQFNQNASNSEQRGMCACEIISNSMLQTQKPMVTILNMASRYISSPDSTQKNDIRSLHMLMNAGLDGKSSMSEKGILNNLLLLLTNKSNDFPAWFYLNNPSVRTIMIDKPSLEERYDFLQAGGFRMFFDNDVYEKCIPYFDDKPQELNSIIRDIALLTDGLMLTDIINISSICRTNKLGIKEYKKSIEIFKYGITNDNPWNKLNADKISELETELKKGIIGQDEAIFQTVDVFKRIYAGLSNRSSGNFGKPKGVLFFAGPTGTGKTQTAKIIAKGIFGREEDLICFDMSEYHSPNSDQRLLGAPPGYVGYESGGQLTNAVMKKPYAIFLFDEIEKAEPTILDKFLQILGEGRLTDGQGKTVYFSESIIIFTSNLGIYSTDPLTGKRVAVIDANNTNLSYSDLKDTVYGAVKEYFENKLGRIEILNRIGDNIVVFNFINSDENINKILVSKLNKIKEFMLEDKKISLMIGQDAIYTLKELCKEKVELGGRGIENVVESVFINALSRYYFDNITEIMKSRKIVVNNLIKTTIGFYEVK